MWSIICVTGVIGEEREDWAEKNMKKTKQNNLWIHEIKQTP